jgi:hypothetical protein
MAVTNNLDLSRAAWRKSTHSNNGGECVETAATCRMLAVRDSKDPEGPTLIFRPAPWTAFTARMKADLLNG